MKTFTVNQPTKLNLGRGKLEEVGDVVKSYGNSCLIVTTPDDIEALRLLYDRVKGILDKAQVRYVHFDEVVPNPSIGGIEKAISIVRKEKLEVILAVGGGSSIDTAKSIALFHEEEKIDWLEVFSKYTSAFENYPLPGRSVLPVIGVPTTAGTGSEMTQAMVISDPEHNDKMCIFHPAAFPKVAIIDPELTITLPTYLTAITGFDAFTHSFESYMRECASPYTKVLGLKSMKTIIETLPKLLKDTSNMDLREDMSLAAAFSGISLSNAAATIPHPLSEVVGGVVPRIPHGQCLACLYPAYLRFQITKEPEKCADIARLMDKKLIEKDEETAANALPELMEEFLKSIGLYNTFSKLGVTKEQLEEMKNNFIFNVLPFAPKDTLLGILVDSY